jgi:hypothetical protein
MQESDSGLAHNGTMYNPLPGSDRCASLAPRFIGTRLQNGGLEAAEHLICRQTSGSRLLMSLARHCQGTSGPFNL